MSVKIKDAGLRFNDNHSDRDGAPKGIVLHHAAIDADVVSIHNYHRDVNGWAGIGYHYYVTKDGEIWNGRPEQWLGAHTEGFNDRIGICAEGNFEEETMPVAQQNAIVQLIAYLQEKYGELPITRHRDHDASACPGTNYPFEAIKAGAVVDLKGDTEGVVFRFQRAALADGIALPQYGSDGIWGAETANAASQYVQYGMTGERVRLVQALVGADADGIFGDETLAAVKAFQESNALDVDGIVGIETWSALLEVQK